MILKSLKLTNYRSYSEFYEEFDKQKIIIIGQNAQGKSNILEAINLIATSSSLRANKDSDLIKFSNEFAIMFANIKKVDEDLEIALQINSSGRRRLKINGVSKKAPQADLIGNFFSVLFSSDDLYLIKGSPSSRRDWIDSLLTQVEPRYNPLIKNYQKATTQKNALLKQAKESGMPTNKLIPLLDVWNDQIITLGSEIIFIRLNLLSDLEPIAKEFQNNISSGNEILDLKYISSIGADLTRDKDILKNLFAEKIKTSFSEEYARGQSVLGPHRDDITFFINEKEAKSFASQGQQRSIVLSIKLSELKVIEKKKNEIPVLLLDDVFAELDESRQDFLLHNLSPEIQTFITTTHISSLQKDLLNNAKVIKIENGKVVEYSLS